MPGIEKPRVQGVDYDDSLVADLDGLPDFTTSDDPLIQDALLRAAKATQNDVMSVTAEAADNLRRVVGEDVSEVLVAAAEGSAANQPPEVMNELSPDRQNDIVAEDEAPALKEAEVVHSASEVPDANVSEKVIPSEAKNATPVPKSEPAPNRPAAGASGSEVANGLNSIGGLVGNVLGGLVSGTLQAGVGVRAAVLPRLSEYRVRQMDEFISTYQDAQRTYFSAPGMRQVKEGIRERALSLGVSETDIVRAMRPDGPCGDLHKAMIEAERASPESARAHVQMDKALASYIKQREKAEPAVRNTANKNDPAYVSLLSQIEDSENRMRAATEGTPLLNGETMSHSQRFHVFLEKIGEFLKSVVAKMKGEAAEVSAGPAI